MSSKDQQWQPFNRANNNSCDILAFGSTPTLYRIYNKAHNLLTLEESCLFAALWCYAEVCISEACVVVFFGGEGANLVDI